MAMSDVVKMVDRFVYEAVKQGREGVADFWKCFGAGMTASLFRDASLSKEAFGLFELAAPEMYAQLRADIERLPVEARAGTFENLRLVANQMQQDGRLPQEKADIVRWVIKQVEADLAAGR